MEDKLEIQYSKKKQMGLLFAGILLMLIGLLYFINIQLPFLYLGKIVSLFFIGTGAFLSFAIGFQMKNQSGPAMMFNNEGFLYNPKDHRFIAWTEIESLTDYSMNSVRTIRIHVKDADAFIAKQENKKIQKAMKIAMKLHDAPIAIQALSIELSTNELLEKLHRYLVKYGNQTT